MSGLHPADVQGIAVDAAVAFVGHPGGDAADEFDAEAADARGADDAFDIGRGVAGGIEGVAVVLEDDFQVIGMDGDGEADEVFGVVIVAVLDGVGGQLFDGEADGVLDPGGQGLSGQPVETPGRVGHGGEPVGDLPGFFGDLFHGWRLRMRSIDCITKDILHWETRKREEIPAAPGWKGWKGPA